MDLIELSNKLNEACSKTEYPTGNIFVMLIEEDFILKYNDWFLLWGKHKDGYYEISGNAVYVIASTLNKVIDVTEQLKS